jgi:RHS repeat-associated protein
MSARADNNLNTSFRGGSIALPSVDDNTSNTPDVPTQNQGRASFSIPLVTPPGRAGLEPGLSLAYTGSRREGVAGAGWSLGGVPSIRVRTSGTGGQPNYGVAVRYLGLGGEELLPTGTIDDADGDGVREPTYAEERNLGYLRYVALTTGGWRVDSPDGISTRFGTSPANRIVRSGAGYAAWISEWLPESRTDRVGNELMYVWAGASAAHASAESTTARYLTRIRYACRSCATAPAYQEVVFTYALRTDQGLAPITDFTTGYLVDTELFLSRIETYSFAGAAQRARTVVLGYDSSGSRLLLSTVAVSGGSAALPIVRLSYTDGDAPAVVPSVLSSPPGATLRAGVQFADVDVDGAVDLADFASGVRWYRNRGAGAADFDSAGVAIASPPGVTLAEIDHSAEDADRNLSMDVVDLGAGRLHAHDGSSGWDGLGTELTLPSIVLDDVVLRADVNLDGRVDLVDTSPADWAIYLDDGSGNYVIDTVTCAGATPGYGGVFRVDEPGVLVGDVNGDGLVDVAKLEPATASVSLWYGRGRGCFGYAADERSDAMEFVPVSSSGVFPVAGKTQLADVDGDGFADLVAFDDALGMIGVWRYVPGTGFTDAGLGGPFFGQSITSENGCRIADVDRDAIAEIVCSSGWKVYDFADVAPMMLAEVDNGRGLVTELAYTTTARLAAQASAAGARWDRNVAAAYPVLASITTNDGRGHVLARTFEYRDAFYVQDEVHDRFALVGFSYIGERAIPLLETPAGVRGADPADPGTLVRRFYHVGDAADPNDDWYKRGLAFCEETWPGTAAPPSFDCGADAGALRRIEREHSVLMDANEVFTVTEDAVDEYALEGDTLGVRIRTERTHDAFGNVLSEIRFGQYDAANPHLGLDESMTVTDWITDEASWLLRLPKRIQRGAPDGGALDVLEVTYLLYDGATDWDVSTASQGLRTETRVWHENTIAGIDRVETIEEVQYTATGMPAVVIDALGYETHRIYDPTFGLFLFTETVDPTGLALVTTQRVDPRHGGITSQAGPDGAVTRASYDLLGRLLTLAKPGDTTASPTVRRAYVDAAPVSQVIDVLKDGTPDGLTTRTRLDGSGRLVCRTQESTHGLVEVLEHNDFSASGALALSTRAYGELSGCRTITRTVTGGVGARAIFGYHDSFVNDALGRRVRAVHSGDGTVREWQYAPLRLTELDEEDTDAGSIHFGTGRVSYFDGQGRTRQVDETHVAHDDDAGTHSFVYDYTPLGDLARVTDSMGNAVFEGTYDSRRRRVRTIETDRGTITTAFDARGAVDTTTDGRGEVVDYTWDAAGRVVSAAASDGTVTYAYDDHPNAAKTASCHSTGRLARVDDLVGATVFCYDSRGRLTSDERTFDAITGVSTTVRTFDSADRLTSLRHADGTRLTYTFGTDGRVNTVNAQNGTFVHPLVTGVGYEPGGVATRIDLGNGAQIAREYDSRVRPTLLALSTPFGMGQNLDIAYDGVGNVESMTDAFGTGTASFVYDDLYRLVEASGARYGGHTASYRYDRLGNLILKTFSDPSSPLDVGALAYDDPRRAHAVTSVGSEVFSYDLAGNLESDATNAYSWTPHSMLDTVTDAATGAEIVDYGYDDRARRVVSERASGEDVFRLPDADAEYRWDGIGTPSLEKYVAVAGMTVAKIDGRITAATVAARVVYFASDHLGSPSLVMNGSGAVIERWDSHPFGEENRLALDAAGLGADYRDPADPTTALTRRFQGRDLGAETGDYDFGARTYRPSLGRFLSPDSVVPSAFDSQSWNRYSFVFNNPLRWVDPSGHAPQCPVVEPPVDLLAPLPAPSPSTPITADGRPGVDAFGVDAHLTRFEWKDNDTGLLLGWNQSLGSYTRMEATKNNPLSVTTLPNGDTRVQYRGERHQFTVEGNSGYEGAFVPVADVADGLGAFSDTWGLVAPIGAGIGTAGALYGANVAGTNLAAVGSTVAGWAPPVAALSFIGAINWNRAERNSVPREAGMPATGYASDICNGSCHY